MNFVLVWAAVDTECPLQKFTSHGSGAWKFKINTLTDSVAGENQIPGLQMVVFL